MITINSIVINILGNRGTRWRKNRYKKGKELSYNT